MLTQTELSNLEQGVYFQKLNCIGKGIGGCVYTINKSYVVKKVPNIGIAVENKSFNRELETTILMSHHNKHQGWYTTAKTQNNIHTM